MDSGVETDQAAGLRKLLHQSPPEVLTVIPCGATAMPWVAYQAALRATLGQRVLAFDEWQIAGCFSDCIGASPRFDLAHGLEGLVTLAECIAESAPLTLERRTHNTHGGVQVLSVARLVREFGGSRILQQQILNSFAALQANADEWLWIARSCDLAGLSPFARAAPRCLLVVQPVERAITEAYAALKRLAKAADIHAVAIAMVGLADDATRAMQARFQRVAATQLGVEVHAVASVGEAFGLPDAMLRRGESASFAESLMLQVGRPQSAKTPSDRANIV